MCIALLSYNKTRKLLLKILDDFNEGKNFLDVTTLYDFSHTDLSTHHSS